MTKKREKRIKETQELLEQQAEQRRQEKYDEFKLDGIKSMHAYMHQFDALTDDEFQQHVCNGLAPEEYYNELLFALYELKSRLLTNLCMCNEHMSFQLGGDYKRGREDGKND